MGRIFNRTSARRSVSRPAARATARPTQQASRPGQPSAARPAAASSATSGARSANSSSSAAPNRASNSNSASAPQKTSSPDKTVASGTASKVKPAEESAAQNKAESLFGNMFSSAQKAFSQAGKTFEFDPKEREKAEAGLAALKKMAGKDGVLTPADRENIIGQMDQALTQEKNKTVSQIADSKIVEAKQNRGPLRRTLFPNAPLVSSVGAKKKAEAMRDPQHMATARNQALGQLNQGLKEMGMPTDQPVNMRQGLQTARQMPSISMADTNSFRDTMMMIKEKAKAMGLPEGQFKKGLPVGFLEDVLAGKPAASLLKHQMMPGQ